jgi:hypothetical protein
LSPGAKPFAVVARATDVVDTEVTAYAIASP